MTSITNILFKFKSNIFKRPMTTKLVLFTSIPSETSSFPYVSIFTLTHAKKFIMFTKSTPNNYCQ